MVPQANVDDASDALTPGVSNHRFWSPKKLDAFDVIVLLNGFLLSEINYRLKELVVWPMHFNKWIYWPMIKPVLLIIAQSLNDATT